MDVLAGLDLVARTGAPAQRAEADRLRVMLTRDPGDSAVREIARQLVDAYLHDPYLERG